VKHLTARRFLISGRVQGVGFRYFAQRVARQIGVKGWARNLDDGSVEVFAAGTAAQISELEGRLRQGPPAADVRGFEVGEAVIATIGDFYIR